MHSGNIFTNELREKIEKHQTELLEDESENQYDTYLSKVFKEVNKCFEKHFKEDYLFGRAYYLPSVENPPLTIVGFCERTPANHVFFDGILEAEEMVKSKTASSLAEFVVTRDILGVILYMSQDEIEPKYIPPLFACHYFPAPNNTFKEIDREKGTNTLQMVMKHEEMAIQSGYKKLFSYVLRTRNLDKDFNGTLYLVLQQPLEIEEYREIIDYFTFIMQVRIKYEVSFKVSKSEWMKISEYRSHALHHQHFARESIKRNLRDAFKDGEGKKFEEYMRRLDVIDNYTKNLDDMEYALQKVQRKKINYDSLEKNDKIKSLLAPRKVELRESLIACVEMIEYSLDLIRFAGEEEHKVTIREKVLPGLIYQIREKFGPLNIQVVPSMFEVIMQDILKNAVKFTSQSNPQLMFEISSLNVNEVHEDVRKQLNSGSEYFCISIWNNKGIDRKQFDFLLHGRIGDELPLEKRVSLGVVTIHRLTSYDGIGKSGERWFYTPSLECLDQNEYTKVLLIIPKNDFV